MVGFTFYYRTCPINLLCEDEANHLMGEGHLREGYLFVGTLVNGRGEAIGTAYYEHQTPTGLLFLFYPCSIFNATVFVPVFIEKNDGVGWLYLLEYQFPFALLLNVF